jgi:hypothetical protein
MTVAWLWRFLILAAGVAGLSLAWVSKAGPLGPLVFFTDQSRQDHRWVHAAVWLLYPLAYLAYALIRGAFFTRGQYPYPFLDVTKHGYLGVTINVVIYGALFYLLGLGLVLLGRLSARHKGTGDTPRPLEGQQIHTDAAGVG